MTETQLILIENYSRKSLKFFQRIKVSLDQNKDPDRIHNNLLSSKLRNGPNKLECLFLAGFPSLVKCLWVRPVAYLRVDLLISVLLGQALSLNTNIRQGYKCLLGTNILAYLSNV